MPNSVATLISLDRCGSQKLLTHEDEGTFGIEYLGV